MKTTLALAALFVLVLLGGYLWKGRTTVPVNTMQDISTTTPAFTTSSTTISTTTVTTATTTTVTTPTKAPTKAPATPAPVSPSSYTSAQVATHNTRNSCWAIIEGSVYDLTSWISQHPGGEGRIIELCGKDGTSAFEGQHGADPTANSKLATFKIGTVAQ